MPSVGVRCRKNVAPDRFALSGIGKRELHHESQAAQERGVERGLQVRRQDRQAAVRFHALQQIAHLDVGVAIVAVAHLAAFAEERIGLVEEQDRAAVLRGVEHPAQVLFGFADVLAHHRGQIDPIEIETQLAGEHFGRHGLARAARAGEERADAETASAFAVKPHCS